MDQVIEVDFSSTNNTEPIKLEDNDVQTHLVYPEQRLWAAVALLLIDDYKDTLEKIRTERCIGPVNRLHSLRLEALRRESKSEWFSIICNNINVHHDHLHKKLDRLDSEYELHTVSWTDEANFGAKYETKKVKDEREYLRIG